MNSSTLITMAIGSGPVRNNASRSVGFQLKSSAYSVTHLKKRIAEIEKRRFQILVKTFVKFC